MDEQTTLEADLELKAKHRAMWALGDYPAVATQVVGPLGPRLVEAAGVGPGQRVLDIGAGSGNASIPAARAGAEVVASDLTPELLETGRGLADDQGLALSWEVADAERLPYRDGEFDTVISCLGVMFAPHHRAAADELLRVVRPGGTVGLINWTPQGFIGQLFATMKPFAPPPPPGSQPPPLWGDEAHVRELLGDRVTDVRAEREELDVERFAGPEEFREFFKAVYGPTIAVYRSLGDDADRIAELDAALADLGARFDLGDGRMRWEYLLVTCRRT